MLTVIKKVHKIIIKHETVDVWFNPFTNNYSLHSSTVFMDEETIVDFYAGTIQSFPTYLTIQTAADTHITLKPDFLQYVNHSCEPNVFFDTLAMQLVCIKPVQPGDELRFFYPSTEWEMAKPFHCNCGAENCLKIITGAADLIQEIHSKYRLTNFIWQQLKQKIQL